MLYKYDISTSKRIQLTNIDYLLNKVINKSNIKSGIIIVYTPHTTSAITINENADPDVVRDIISFTSAKIPENNNFRHREGNSDSHIKSSLIGASETIIIENGSPVLGTWQSLYFCEFDGPRNRHIYFKVIKD